MANILTGLRVVFSLMLLFTRPLSPHFYCIYIAAGLTDMLDGIAARRLNSVSDLGARLDTAADICFVGVALLMLIPLLQIPTWLWLWFILITLIKISNIISGFVIYGKMASEHTVMNKITGVLLFTLPFSLTVVDYKYSLTVICAAATISAIQEGYRIKSGSFYV